MDILTLQLDSIKEDKLQAYIDALNSTEYWPNSTYLLKLLKPYKYLEFVMPIYCRCCANNTNYTHYINSNNNLHLVIKNDFNFISNGTTGLTTWGGSVWMLDFIHTIDISNKTIIELGCGTGLLGIGCLTTGAAKVILTDCNEQVLALCKENILLNSNMIESDKSYQVQLLDWSKCYSIMDFEFQLINDTIVVMADVCYDVSVIDDLCRVILLFKTRGIPIYMGYSIRNKETFHLFMTKSKGKIIHTTRPKQYSHFNQICSEFVVISFD